MSHLFISYARKDIDFVSKIVQGLAEKDLKAWVDWESLPKGEDWQREIYRGIDEADAFLFLISPDSVRSEYCRQEIERALSSHKRILPIVIRDTAFKDTHLEISKRNWTFCRADQDDFSKALEEICKAIHTDYEWLKYHTELQVKALKWGQYKDASRLLRGRELEEAEKQLARVETHKDPQPTEQQREFVLQSRREEQSRQRRNRNILAAVLGVVLVLACIAVVASFIAVVQRNQAVTAQVEAERQANIALAGQLAAQAQLILNKKEDASSPLVASLLSIESIQRYPNAEADETLRRSMSSLVSPHQNILTSHPESISDIVFSPDGRFIASSDFADNVRIWQVDTGGEIASWRMDGRVTAMKFAPDGRSLLVADDSGIVSVWDLEKKTSFALCNHFEGSVALDMNIAGDRLITGGADGIIRIWDSRTLSLIITLDQGSPIESLVISPDETTIISSGEDSMLKVWEVATGEEKYQRPTNYFGAFAMDISPDGRKVVSGSDNGVEIWDLSSGETLGTFGETSTEDLGFFSPDGSMVATYRGFNNGHVLIWDSESLEQISEITLDFYITDMAFTEDGMYMIIGSEDGSTRVWDLQTGTEISRMLQEGRVYSVALSPRRGEFATAGVDRVIYFWSYPSSNRQTEQQIDPAGQNPILDSNGQWVAFKSQNPNQVDLLQISTGSVAASILNSSPVFAAALSPDGKSLATASEDASVCIWDILTSTKTVCRTGLEGISVLKFNNDATWLALQSGKSIKIWKSPAGEEVITIPTNFVINTFAFDSGNGLLAIGAGGDSQIEVWNILAGQKIIEFQHDPSVKISDVIFSEDGKWLISSGIDSTARVWDLKTGEEVSKITYDPEEYTNMYEVLKTRPSPDGKRLLSVNEVAIFNINNDAVTARESTLRVWDPLSGQEIKRFIHNSWVNEIAWSPDGHYVFSAGWDGVLRIWDVESGVEVGRINHDAPIESLAFTPSGSEVISISSDGEYKVSYWSPEDLINNACARLPRNLKLAEWTKFFGSIVYHATCPNLPIPTE